jgi:hypothetical protein
MQNHNVQEFFLYCSFILLLIYLIEILLIAGG